MLWYNEEKGTERLSGKTMIQQVGSNKVETRIYMLWFSSLAILFLACVSFRYDCTRILWHRAISFQ